MGKLTNIFVGCLLTINTRKNIGSYEMRELIPSVGSWVSIPSSKSLGRVTEVGSGTAQSKVKVVWGQESRSSWHDIAELRSGFRAGHVVQDKPRSNIASSLGTGTVQAIRNIGLRDQVSVQSHKTGETRWIPFENLIRIRDSRMKYLAAEAPESDAGERFRLKALAYALDSWNQVTGALDRLDVDPLPHQIDLVHRIMTSDQSNWLIADDVGLGKTIEVGLLLAAMKRRRQARRVLVVCPAGVVRQWQDEMAYKFNESFRIYGLDFNIPEASHWPLYEKVIVSIDRAKNDSHVANFLDSGDWDVIIFDEAHHLSKIEHQAATQRYQLAERLRGLTDAFLFLSGTPHRGKTDQFVNILQLLRPDLAPRFATMFTDPSVVAEVVLRNRKSHVTDASGELIFRGQDTRLVQVPLSDSVRSFNAHLLKYLKNGYAASETGGNAARAIGFVMTTYRKLASSSIVAIERALERRLERLKGNADSNRTGSTDLSEFESGFEDGIDGEDDLDKLAERLVVGATGANPFFADELQQIRQLIELADGVKRHDLKLDRFFDDIVEVVRAEDQKLLIFTEYRATQDYLVDNLKSRYPSLDVAQIHGSMSLEEKRRNIDSFNAEAQFMVSTEAGGEGINLHEDCHILANYDLPWNPGRLVQRTGRLYRYGQKERVVTFNLLSDDGFDNKALSMLLQRVSTMARDMAQVSEEFRDGIETEIIGELLERIDTSEILALNKDMDVVRTQIEIEDAIARARQAKSQQDRLFSNIEGYDPITSPAIHKFGPEEVLQFLEAILPYQNVQIRNRLYNGRILEIVLPERLRGRYADFPERASIVRITPYRELTRRISGVAPMDFKSNFFANLIEFAQSPEFKGEFAKIGGPRSGTLGLYKLRWQTDQGVPREESLISVFLPDEEDDPVVDPEFFGSLLLRRNHHRHTNPSSDLDQRKAVLKQIDQIAHDRLADRCTSLRHPNDVILLATADLNEES